VPTVLTSGTGLTLNFAAVPANVRIGHAPPEGI
jgi:hypothetical protein